MYLPDNMFLTIKTSLITFIVTMTLYLMYSFGQGAERLLHPVVSRIEITATQKVDEDTTRIWVTFDKLRECRPLEVYWYRGRRDGLFERVTFRVEKPLGGGRYANRPIGLQKSGPWIVGVPIEDIKNRAFSDAHHDCWPLWTTVSRFYN